MKDLLQKQKQLCAEAVRKAYLKSGMTNLAERAYNDCLNAPDAEGKATHKHRKKPRKYVSYNSKVHDAIAYRVIRKYNNQSKLIESLDVSFGTINSWFRRHKSFRDAYNRGKYEYFPYSWKDEIPPVFNPSVSDK